MGELERLLKSANKQKRQVGALLSEMLKQGKCSEVLTIDKIADMLHQNDQIRETDKFFKKGEFKRFKEILSLHVTCLFNNHHMFMIVINNPEITNYLLNKVNPAKLKQQLEQTRRELNKQI